MSISINITIQKNGTTITQKPISIPTPLHLKFQFIPLRILSNQPPFSSSLIRSLRGQGTCPLGPHEVHQIRLLEQSMGCGSPVYISSS